MNEINLKKKVPLWRFIWALGIVHVGEQTARDLANHFQTLDMVMKASEEELNTLENIGPSVSESIYKFFRDKENLKFIEKLKEKGVSITENTKEGKEFSGLVFVLTGTLKRLSRDEAKREIISRGGKVSGSISKNTSFLVKGDNPGSKLEKAKRDKVKLLNEDQFIQILKKEYKLLS